MPSSSDTICSRRHFLKLSALAAGASVIGFPSLLRAQNTGTKLNVAVIGLGPQGNHRGREAIWNKSVNLIAICDVDTAVMDKTKAALLNKAREKWGESAVSNDSIRLYTDYRELLANEKNLDAVIVTTPDHWHAPIAKAAMLAGKHVFCEKPLTRTIGEARELRNLAAKSKVVTQMGNQGSATKNLRRAVEVIQSGVLGEVHAVHCWVKYGGGGGRPIPTTGEPIPEGFNWDQWLGPAPQRAYRKGWYHPYSWRNWYDFGAGPMGDFGCHSLNLPVRALKLDYPVTIDVDAQLMGMPSYPKQARIDFQFAQRGKLPPVMLSWYDGGRQPDKSLFPEELTSSVDINGIGQGTLIIGSNGFTYGEPWSGADYIYLKGDPKLFGILNHPACKTIPTTLPKSPGHFDEWVSACMGGPPVFSDFETGGHLTEIALSGVLALRMGKKLEWDGPGMRAKNAPEADQYIHPTYRHEWL